MVEIVKTNPDPTEAVKEALTLAIKNLSEKIGNQFDANDRAVALARDELAAQLAALVLTISANPEGKCRQERGVGRRYSETDSGVIRDGQPNHE